MSEVSSKPNRAGPSSAAPLVVGVGASAGGLEAISALLSGLPGDAPVGIVVLQHHDQTHGSSLAELLARQTRLEVLPAADGALVEAGQVHVIPPNAELRISGGRLQLVPRAAMGTHLPIDDFFDSLARDRGRGAAGVVLSGTGADGAQGVRALRRVGAATFAQDASAIHTGMPTAATATGCVDMVLAPVEIALRLIHQLEVHQLEVQQLEHATVNETVRRNAEATRANDDLTNVLESVGIAILILERDSRIRRFTPAAARLLNLIATDVGRPISEIKSNLRAPDLMQLVGDVLEHLAPRERTVTDETGHWYQLTVRPYLTTDRKVDGTVVTIVDVDAIQRGKTMLAEALDYAEGIVDTVRDPLLVLDEHRRVRSANRSFYRKFQVSREELEGKAFDQLGSPRWVPPVLIAALDRLAAHPATDDARLEDTPSRFAGRSMLVSGRPLLRAGQAPWVLLAFEDLTEQMRSDAAVRRSERALREMLGAASEAILIANGNGLITYANEMAARTFAYPLEELTGLSIEKLVPEDRRDGEEERDHDAFQAPGSVMGANREVRGRRKDGTLFPAEVGLSVMEGEQGPLVVAFISDVTARHEAEARISAYKKNLQEMAFDAALVEERQRRKLAADLHDNIGQTLALAQIRLKAAQPGVGSPAAAKDLAEGIKLIGVALTDTRELTFELSPPVLYDLGLPAAVAWLGEQLEAQHHLHVEVEADQPFEKVEDETAGLLFRAVRELLTNVVKHAKTSQAAVSVHRKGGQLTVVVEDQGTGFDPERLKNYEAAKGFGLFSVREQITRLGGTFEATSSPSQGTCITLQIPINDRRSVQPATGDVK